MQFPIRRCVVISAALASALAVTSLIAQTSASPQQVPAKSEPAAETDPAVLAAQAWIGRALILRGAYTGNDFDFDAAGRPKGSPKTTDWTLAGFDLEKVSKRPGGELLLEGIRVAIGYNQIGHVFERHPLKEEHLRITLSAQSVEAEMSAIFSQGIDPAFERSLPPYWSHYFLPQLDWPADELKGQTILGLKSNVPADLTMPAPERKAEPELTPEARAAHIKGSVQLSVVVDPTGLPRRMVLRQPLGWGLDARVAEPLARFRFKPATQSGKPVAVEIVFNQAFDYVAAP